MFKAVILLTRRGDMSRVAFRKWWLDDHASMARQLPGCRRLVFNVIENDPAPCDGIAELWFDSHEAFDAAYATELGRQVAADSAAHVSARVRLFANEVVELAVAQ